MGTILVTMVGITINAVTMEATTMVVALTLAGVEAIATADIATTTTTTVVEVVEVVAGGLSAMSTKVGNLLPHC